MAGHRVDNCQNPRQKVSKCRQAVTSYKPQPFPRVCSEPHLEPARYPPKGGLHQTMSGQRLQASEYRRAVEAEACRTAWRGAVAKGVRRRSCLMCAGQGQDELKGRARARVGRGPQPSLVRFDDRAADRLASPRPMPCGFVVKKALNSRSTCSGSIPMPESCTATSTAWDACVPELIRNSRARWLTPLRASMPFMSRFSSTCCNWTRSPSTPGR
jgi:hypothetical protein